MGRRIRTIVLAALLSVCVLPTASAWAAPDLSGLADRYAPLSELRQDAESADSVVVDTHVSVLTSVNRALDGSVVSFTGEAIGSAINAGMGHKWVNLLGSDGSVIGVYMTDAEASMVESWGDYHQTGTTLLVSGAYSVACDEHQGELDVHATSVEVVEKGSAIEHEVSIGTAKAGAVCIISGIALLVLFFVFRKKIMPWVRKNQRVRAHRSKKEGKLNP